MLASLALSRLLAKFSTDKIIILFTSIRVTISPALIFTDDFSIFILLILISPFEMIFCAFALDFNIRALNNQLSIRCSLSNFFLSVFSNLFNL